MNINIVLSRTTILSKKPHLALFYFLMWQRLEPEQQWPIASISLEAKMPLGTLNRPRPADSADFSLCVCYSFVSSYIWIQAWFLTLVSPPKKIINYICAIIFFFFYYILVKLQMRLYLTTSIAHIDLIYIRCVTLILDWYWMDLIWVWIA